jgi:hypothetical protein
MQLVPGKMEERGKFWRRQVVLGEGEEDVLGEVMG